MKKYNIIQRLLERNGYGNTTVLLHKTPLDILEPKCNLIHIHVIIIKLI